MDIFELVKSAPPADPLSETTRAERRSLLAVNLVAIALTAGGLIPSEVSALGISLTAREQRGLLVLLLLVVLYYFAAFLIYGLPEWRRAMAEDQLFRQRLADFIKPWTDQSHSDQIDYAELEEVFAVARHAKLVSYYRSGRSVRIAFDFLVPIGISIWSISLLIGGILERPVTSTVDWSNPAIWAVLATIVSLFVWGGLAWRQWWKEQAPTRARQYMRRLSDMIRKALEFPEGSAERERAKKLIEEKLRNFATRRKESTMSKFVPVAKLSEIPDQTVKCVQVEGRSIALFNLGGQLYALDDTCTHEGGPLSEGLIHGEEVECPWHGSRFHIITGKVTLDPAMEDVVKYNLRLNGDDIEVEV